MAYDQRATEIEWRSPLVRKPDVLEMKELPRMVKVSTGPLSAVLRLLHPNQMPVGVHELGVEVP